MGGREDANHDQSGENGLCDLHVRLPTLEMLAISAMNGFGSDGAHTAS
jgi:hypothetical protein